jgi:hypothetical protein
MDNTPTPPEATNQPTPPPLSLDEWATQFCPGLPGRFAAVVAEWDLSDGDKIKAVTILLGHVRQSVKTE